MSDDYLKEYLIDCVLNDEDSNELMSGIYRVFNQLNRLKEVEGLLAEYQNDWTYLVPEMTRLKNENVRFKKALMEIAQGEGDYYANEDAQIALEALRGGKLDD